MSILKNLAFLATFIAGLLAGVVLTERRLPTTAPTVLPSYRAIESGGGSDALTLCLPPMRCDTHDLAR